jgi:methionyl-tRNA formyltransferase
MRRFGSGIALGYAGAMELAVALAAEDAAGVQALRMLARRGIRPVAVFTGAAEAGPAATVAAAAAKLDVPAIPAAELTEPSRGSWLREQGTDLLLNVHSLHIVADPILEAPRLGAFNLHPGPLPECAGLNSPSWAIYSGAESHGVTLHRMTPGVDEGPIAFEERFAIGPDDTGLTVLTQSVRRGIGLLEQLLDGAERGEPIPAHAQDLSRLRWFGHGPPDRGRLDWSRPARAAVDFVRACDYGPFPSPWGRPIWMVDGEEVRVVAAELAPGDAAGAPGTIVAVEDGDVLVAAADGLVRVQRVEVAGQPAMPSDALEAVRAR